jgi:hypothetical protein
VDEILEQIKQERLRQVRLYGNQTLPEGASPDYAPQAEYYKRKGTATWAEVLLEEVFEAISETNPEERKKELVQVAAVCVKWLEEVEK